MMMTEATRQESLRGVVARRRDLEAALLGRHGLQRQTVVAVRRIVAGLREEEAELRDGHTTSGVLQEDGVAGAEGRR